MPAFAFSSPRPTISLLSNGNLPTAVLYVHVPKHNFFAIDQGRKQYMIKLKREHNYGYLNFFEIERSGLYKLQRRSSGEDIVSRSYGLDTAEVFRSLQTWIAGRALKETCPWPSRGDSETESIMCYCREIKEFPNGDFMVVLWK